MAEETATSQEKYFSLYFRFALNDFQTDLARILGGKR